MIKKYVLLFALSAVALNPVFAGLDEDVTRHLLLATQHRRVAEDREASEATRLASEKNAKDVIGIARDNSGSMHEFAKFLLEQGAAERIPPYPGLPTVAVLLHTISDMLCYATHNQPYKGGCALAGALEKCATIQREIDQGNIPDLHADPQLQSLLKSRLIEERDVLEGEPYPMIRVLPKLEHIKGVSGGAQEFPPIIRATANPGEAFFCVTKGVGYPKAPEEPLDVGTKAMGHPKAPPATVEEGPVKPDLIQHGPFYVLIAYPGLVRNPPPLSVDCFVYLGNIPPVFLKFLEGDEKHLPDLCKLSGSNTLFILGFPPAGRVFTYAFVNPENPFELITTTRERRFRDAVVSRGSVP